MDVSTPDEAFSELFPYSSSDTNKEEFWAVIKHLELGAEWELAPIPYKMPVDPPVFSIRWNGYAERTTFREVTDRIFVNLDPREQTYTVQIPVLSEEHAYEEGEFLNLRSVSFGAAKDAADHIDSVEGKARSNMMRNAFIETNHDNAIRIAYDPVSEQFISGKEMSWSKAVDDDRARIYSGDREEQIESIDRLVGYRGEQFDADGEQIDPEDPCTITIHSPKSIVSVYGVGKETKYSIGMEFGTYDNIASASISEVTSRVDTSSYYNPNLEEMRNSVISAIQTAERIYDARKEDE